MKQRLTFEKLHGDYKKKNVGGLNTTPSVAISSVQFLLWKWSSVFLPEKVEKDR